VGRCGLVVYSSGLGPMAASCEQGDEPSSSINGGEFPVLLSDSLSLE
jgi:hypothetical protein